MGFTDIRQLLPKNVYDAAIGANAPSAANVYATMADVGGGGGGSSAGTSNEHQVTDNAGGFVTSILQETGGQIGAGGVTTSAVFALNSITDLGMTLPTGTVAQRTAIATPVDGLHFYTEDGTTSVPYYNHSAAGWVPVGRYASLGAVIDTGGVPVANKHFVSANMDGEQFYAPFRWGIVSGTTQFYGTDVNGALKSADLGEASGTGRWRDLYCKGSFKHQYGAITAYNAGNAAMTFRANQAGSNPQMALVATTNQRGLIIRDDDGATFNLDNSAILELASSTRGILIPRMASPSVTLAAAPPTIIVHDNSLDAPVYKHATDGFIPIGRYAGVNTDNGTVGANYGIVQTAGPFGKITGGNLKANSTIVRPVTQATGAHVDATIDLGASTNRFRDIHAIDFITYGGNNGFYFDSGNHKITGATTHGVCFSRAGNFVANIGNATSNKGLILYDDDPAVGKTIDTTALIEMQSTTRGFLPPRMTTVQMNAIATPVEGLIVHATDADRPHYNDGTSWKGFGDLYGLYAQTAASTPIGNTTTEGTLIGSGVGGLSVPADAFRVGDSFHAKIGGTWEVVNNAHTITFRIKVNGTEVATTGVIANLQETDQPRAWELELDFTIISLGSGGVGSGQLCTNGNLCYIQDNLDYEGTVFQDTQDLDTTAANTLDITAQWGQAGGAAQTISSSQFVLYRTYKGS